MNRRLFIKAAASFTAVTALGIDLTADLALDEDIGERLMRERLEGFNPNLEYGDFCWYTRDSNIDEITKELIERVTEFIPMRYMDRVKLYAKPEGWSGLEDPLNEIATIGWKYTPERLNVHKTT